MTTETDGQNVSQLLDDILTSLAFHYDAGMMWRGVARLYRALSRMLAQCVEGGSSSDGVWDTFSDIWKQVLRHVVGLIADNGGWVSPLLFF